MTEEQKSYIKDWITKNDHIRDNKWLEFSDSCIDHLWDVDEESYQMKKYLKNNFDEENLSSEERILYNEASSLCSYIDELCGIMLYATPSDWEAPEYPRRCIKPFITLFLILFACSL